MLNKNFILDKQTEVKEEIVTWRDIYLSTQKKPYFRLRYHQENEPNEGIEVYVSKSEFAEIPPGFNSCGHLNRLHFGIVRLDKMKFKVFFVLHSNEYRPPEPSFRVYSQGHPKMADYLGGQYLRFIG